MLRRSLTPLPRRLARDNELDSGRVVAICREGEKLSFDLEDDRKGSGKKSAANLKQV
jgi:hypothetical protein